MATGASANVGEAVEFGGEWAKLGDIIPDERFGEDAVEREVGGLVRDDVLRWT